MLNNPFNSRHSSSVSLQEFEHPADETGLAVQIVSLPPTSFSVGDDHSCLYKRIVGLLFTDVEGSTRILRDVGLRSFRALMAEYRRRVRSAIRRRGGVEADAPGGQLRGE